MYESAKEASLKTGHHINLILNCCKRKNYTVGGRIGNPVIFRYSGDIFDYMPYKKIVSTETKIKLSKPKTEEHKVKLRDAWKKRKLKNIICGKDSLHSTHS